MRETHQLFQAAASLLRQGAFIQEASSEPITYRLHYAGDSAPIAGHLVQQLLAHRLVRPTCRVSGKMRYLAV